MTSECTCHSGTEAGGWFERVCPVCREAEIQQWADMMHRFRHMDVRQYRRNHLRGKPIVDVHLPDGDHH